MTVLQLTDFHITGSRHEHLRPGYYKEYVRGLVASIRDAGCELPTSVIVTGDFVDQGKIDNFKQAEQVLAYICEQLSLGPENVAVCIGNHDLVRAEDSSGRYGKARAAFNRFAQKYANGHPLGACGRRRAVLCKPADACWCLVLDSTLGCSGEDRPGNLTTAEADEVIQLVDDQVPETDLLIVAAHHPIQTFPGMTIPWEEADGKWFARHFWYHGIMLRERIRHLGRAGPVVWLFGDAQ